jgi:hypothetical protein
MQMVEPQPEHRWLQQFVGEWTSETEAPMEPGQPPQTFRGTETVRSLGALWILAEGKGEMPGGTPMTTVLTLGYDPQKQRYVGTFVGSMMTWLWVYDGMLDVTARVLTLDTEGPSMTGDGKLTSYRDSFELVSPDHRVLRSRMLGDDGQWHPVMTAHYRRAR